MDLMLDDNAILTYKGLALIKKLLKSRGIMHYTRMTIGDGEIPDGTDLKNITDLFNPQISEDARIAEWNEDGEATVFSIFLNETCDMGFFITEIGLFAEDPDEGEILYAYLDKHEHPDWMRPKGGSIGREITVFMTVAVGDVENITVVISPNSFVTHEELYNILEEYMNESGTGNPHPIHIGADEPPEDFPVEGIWVKLNGSVNAQNTINLLLSNLILSKTLPEDLQTGEVWGQLSPESPELAQPAGITPQTLTLPVAQSEAFVFERADFNVKTGDHKYKTLMFSTVASQILTEDGGETVAEKLAELERKIKEYDTAIANINSAIAAINGQLDGTFYRLATASDGTENGGSGEG